MYYLTKENQPVKRNTPTDGVEITEEEYKTICKERNDILKELEEKEVLNE